MSNFPVAATTGLPKSIKTLVNSGKSLEAISLERGESREAVEVLLRNFGADNYGSQDRTSYVNYLHRLGVHPSVVAVLLDTPNGPSSQTIRERQEVESVSQETSITASSDVVHLEIMALISRGFDIKHITDNLGVEMQVIIEAVSAYENGTLPVTGPPNQEADDSPTPRAVNAEPRKTSSSIDSPSPEKLQRSNVDAASEVVRLAKLNRTLSEISDESGVSKIKVIRIAKKAGVYFPTTDKIRLELDMVARLAQEGNNLKEIAEIMALSQGYLRSQLNESIRGYGRGHDIFAALLSKKPVADKDSDADAISSNSAPQHATCGTTPQISVRDLVKVKSRDEMTPRDGVSWLQGRTVEVESILHGVAMISLVYRGEKVHELVLVNELKIIREADSLTVGEEVSFNYGGERMSGMIKTVAMMIRDEWQYGVVSNEQDFIVKFTDIQS